MLTAVIFFSINPQNCMDIKEQKRKENFSSAGIKLDYLRLIF